MGLVVVAVGLVCGGSAAVLARIGRPLVATPFDATASAGTTEADTGSLRKRAVRAEKELDKLHPKGVYIVVDAYRNRLHLVENGRVIRSAVCSTGQDPAQDLQRKQWVFDTPLGERVVERNMKHLSGRSRWAFVERPAPPTIPTSAGDASRDYALISGTASSSTERCSKSLWRRVTTDASGSVTI
jgi:hypothetical protein